MEKFVRTETYPNMTLKTSEDWYQNYYRDRDIIDPDGWRDETDPRLFWYTERISWSEFTKRVNICSMGPYGMVRHDSPFKQKSAMCEMCLKNSCAVTATHFVSDGEETISLCKQHADATTTTPWCVIL